MSSQSNEGKSPRVAARRKGQRQNFWRVGAAGVVALLLIGGVFYSLSGGDAPKAKKVPPEIKVVNLQPPPPPPPPPPQKQPEQKLTEQPKMKEPEIKQEKVNAPKPLAPKTEAKANDLPPGSVLLGAGSGPGNGFGVGGGDGRGGGGGSGGGGGGGGGWGYYSSIVISQVQAALRANSKTKNASIGGVKVRLWADGSGRVTRVQLDSSTGDPEVDSAIRNEALMGLSLREPPPKDMPMPILVRITERRPSRG